MLWVPIIGISGGVIQICNYRYYHRYFDEHLLKIFVGNLSHIYPEK
jgi:hypothetical protein